MGHIYHHQLEKVMPEYWSPDQLGMTYKNLTVLSPDDRGEDSRIRKLHGWFVYHKGISDKIPTIVYFHENDYYPPARLYTIQQYWDSQDKYNVIMVDYKGYGLSEGFTSEEGVLIDSEAIFEHVLSMEEIDQDQIYLLGCSMGGFPSINVATKYQEKIKGFILQNTLVNVEHLVSTKYPPISPILPYILRINLENGSKMKNLTLPMMFIVSIDDGNTPSEGMYKLYHEANNVVYKKLYDVNTRDHFFPYFVNPEEYSKKISHFIQNCSSEKIQKYHKEAYQELHQDQSQTSTKSTSSTSDTASKDENETKEDL